MRQLFYFTSIVIVKCVDKLTIHFIVVCHTSGESRISRWGHGPVGGCGPPMSALFCKKCIGGSRGGVLAHAPLQDPILSFLHTFSLESAHLGGQTHPPPKWVHTPPMKNPGSGPELYVKMKELGPTGGHELNMPPRSANAHCVKRLRCSPDSLLQIE